MNLSTFFIDHLIVHDVPRHPVGGTAEPIVFSEVESSLDNALRNFFKERVNRSLASQGYEVERDPAATSPVPGLIARILDDDDDLVDASQEMARHLYASQTGVNPAGLLVVARGQVDGGRAVMILKLEREDAIRVHQTSIDGHATFDVAYLKDLMLGKNTRLFKSSLFVSAGGDDGVALDGLVSDDQRGYDPASEVANFFLGRFLGCRLKTAADVATKHFFEATQDWINDAVAEPEKKARYEIALLQQMNATATTIVPNSFAKDNLDVSDRQNYRRYLQEREAPSTRFDKDLKLVERRVRQMSMAFEQSDLRLSGSSEAIDRYVKVKPDDAEGAPVEIHDRVKRVRGGR